MSEPPPPRIVVQSPGVVGIATSAVDALRGAPMLLVLVLLNCAFIFSAAYYLRIQQDNITRLVDKMLDRCLAVKQTELAIPPARPYSPTPDNFGYLPSKLTDLP